MLLICYQPLVLVLLMGILVTFSYACVICFHSMYFWREFTVGEAPTVVIY
jgi:hypothetical protein